MESWKAKLLFPQKEHVGSWFGLLVEQRETLSISLSGAGFPRCWCLLFPYTKQSNRGLKRAETSAKSMGPSPVKLSSLFQEKIIHGCPMKIGDVFKSPPFLCSTRTHRTFGGFDGFNGMLAKTFAATNCYREAAASSDTNVKKNLGLFRFHLVFCAFIPLYFCKRTLHH